MNAVSIRGDLVGQVIDGRFSLLEWLGGSGTSGTFLTELDGPGSRRAAIKLFSAPAQAEDRLSTWTATATLSHVHLVRILHFGRAEIDGVPLAYVVTELAEEVLSQIIPERPLTAEEARQMLEPVLDALSYLHSKDYVHAHLKPSNILVVENEVKLSADGMIASGEPALGVQQQRCSQRPGDSDRTRNPGGGYVVAGRNGGGSADPAVARMGLGNESDPVLPASVPKPFDEIARECLHVDPARRCTLTDIRLFLEGKSKRVPAAGGSRGEATRSSEDRREIVARAAPAGSADRWIRSAGGNHRRALDSQPQDRNGAAAD